MWKPRMLSGRGRASCAMGSNVAAAAMSAGALLVEPGERLRKYRVEAKPLALASQKVRG